MNNKDYQSELDGIVKAETALKSKEIDLKEDVSRAKAELDNRIHKIAADKKRLKALKVTEEPFTNNQPELKEYTQEELASFDVDNLLQQVKYMEETLPKTRPNLGAIQEYQKQRKV